MYVIDTEVMHSSNSFSSFNVFNLTFVIHPSLVTYLYMTSVNFLHFFSLFIFHSFLKVTLGPAQVLCLINPCAFLCVYVTVDDHVIILNLLHKDLHMFLSQALSGVGESLQNIASVTKNTALTAALNTQFLLQIGIFTAVPMILGFILEQGFLRVIMCFSTHFFDEV